MSDCVKFWLMLALLLLASTAKAEETATSGSITFDTLSTEIWASSNVTPALIMNPEGNITIGTADLASTSSKLFVDGSATFAGDVEFKGKVTGLPEPKPLEMPNTDWILLYLRVLVAQAILLAAGAMWWMKRIADRAKREIEERIAEIVITLDEHERWEKVLR